MLRAFHLRIDPEAQFDGRHDLRLWYVSSQYDRILADSKKNVADAALSNLYVQWQNDHRYHSEAALRLFFKRKHLDRGIKGDALKELTARTYNDARYLVTIGEKGWDLWKPI